MLRGSSSGCVSSCSYQVLGDMLRRRLHIVTDMPSNSCALTWMPDEAVGSGLHKPAQHNTAQQSLHSSKQLARQAERMKVPYNVQQQKDSYLWSFTIPTSKVKWRASTLMAHNLSTAPTTDSTA